MLDEAAEAKKFAATVMSQDPERQAVLIARAFQLIYDDRSYSAADLYKWISDDGHHTWNKDSAAE